MATTGRRFVSSFGHQESVDQVFLASDKQLRANRNGNLYIQVDLSDRSGTINARMWNAKESDYRNFENGDYVRVDGTTQLFQGAIQLIANQIRRANPSEVDESEFLTVSGPEVDRMAGRLAELLRTVKNPHLRSLAECFLMDEHFMSKFIKAPAGIKNHHAYQAGLLEHVVNLMELVVAIAPRYPQIDPELLLLGAFLHDIAKVDELSYERDLAYTDEGQLVGHIVMGVAMLETKIREAERLSGEPFPAELALRLKHMTASHHGQHEYGSPRLPMTLEAVALHQLDNLDARVHNFHQLIRDDPNKDSAWTQYHPNLGRKLYKGSGS